jgi:polysaccharide export outer membrane protein
MWTQVDDESLPNVSFKFCAQLFGVHCTYFRVQRAGTGADHGVCCVRRLPGAPEYKLGPGDKVRITVYGEPTLSGEFLVSTAGKISFPMVGEIDANGLTTREITTKIATKLSDGYILNPQVSSEVLTYRPFYILGEVNKPGEYPYTSDLTVIKAVATAQGFTYRANSRKFFIRHAGDVEEHEYPLDGNVYVQPGDTIRIIERHF